MCIRDRYNVHSCGHYTIICRAYRKHFLILTAFMTGKVHGKVIRMWKNSLSFYSWVFKYCCHALTVSGPMLPSCATPKNAWNFITLSRPNHPLSLIHISCPCACTLDNFHSKYFPNQRCISKSLVTLLWGFPLLDSSWFSPWNKIIRVSQPLRFKALNSCMASLI